MSCKEWEVSFCAIFSNTACKNTDCREALTDQRLDEVLNEAEAKDEIVRIVYDDIGYDCPDRIA